MDKLLLLEQVMIQHVELVPSKVMKACLTDYMLADLVQSLDPSKSAATLSYRCLSYSVDFAT